MKQILSHSIQNIDSNITDGKFLFLIPKTIQWDFMVDMAELLAPYKNENLDYSADPKLWSEVYSPKSEWDIFQKIVEEALETKKKIHIQNISLAEEVEYIKNLYEQLGYFNAELNAFVPDFKNCPITIGVNLRNFVYSFKDYYILGEPAFFIPPPRAPLHQKAIRSGLNSWVISAIHLNRERQEEEKETLEQLLLEEKTNLLKLGRLVCFNLEEIGFQIETEDWIIQLGESS